MAIAIELLRLLYSRISDHPSATLRISTERSRGANQNGAVTPTASGEPGNMRQADNTTEIDINQETEVIGSDENNQDDSEVDESTDSPVLEETQQSEELDINQETDIQSIPLDEDNQESPEPSESTTFTNSEILKEANQSTDSFNLSEMRLTTSELAERLGLQPQSLSNAVSRHKEAFPEWSKKRDPDGISWQGSNEKKGIARLFIPTSIENDETHLED